MAFVLYNGEKLFSLSPGQSGTLLCFGKHMKGNIVVKAEDSIEEYDGSVIIETIFDLISFTIDGISYQAEREMTWREWCSSSYNTKGLMPESYENGEYTLIVDSSESYMLAYNNGSSTSYANDTIEDGGVYVMTDYV